MKFGRSATFVYGRPEDRIVETVHETKWGSTETGFYAGDGKDRPIISTSTANGCPIGCNFCQVTKPGRNLTRREIIENLFRVAAAAEVIGEFGPNREVKFGFARVGEPTFNPAVPDVMAVLTASSLFTLPGNETRSGVRFKYYTAAPQGPHLKRSIAALASFASRYRDGTVQLTISMSSTDEKARQKILNGKLAVSTFAELRRDVIEIWYENNQNAHPRKPNLSFVVAPGAGLDPKVLKKELRPELVKIRLRPVLPNCETNSHFAVLTSRALHDAVRRFKDEGYEASAAGDHTPQEYHHGLVIGTTRDAVQTGKKPNDGIYFVHDDKSWSAVPEEIGVKARARFDLMMATITRECPDLLL